LQTSFASVRYTLAYLVARVLRLSDLGEKLLEDPSAWLPAQRDDIAKQLETYVDFVVDETNYFVSDREEQRQQNPDAEPFDPKTIFKASTGVRPLERQVIQAVKALARRADSEILFDLEPGRPASRQSGR
jgi:hypothetical protein